jgi:hypothetical protein
MRRTLPTILVVFSLLIAGCGGSKKDDVTDSGALPTWEKTIGGEEFERANAIIAAPGGGYVVAGTIGPSDGSDVYLVKIDANGEIVWERTIGGSGLDEVFSLVATSDGGYLLAGNTNSMGYGEVDSYLLKVDGSGNKVWDHAYGGSGDDRSVFATSLGDTGYIVAGTDQTGTLIERIIRGEGAADVYAGAATSDGGAIIACVDPSSGHTFADVYLIKLDATGAVLWENTYGGEMAIRPRSIAPVGQDYIIAGDVSSSVDAKSNAYLARVDGSGNVVWEQTFGSNQHDELHCVVPTTDGGFILAGWTLAAIIRGSDAYLVKTSAAGVVEWERTFGGDSFDEGYGVATTSEGGYLLVGRTASFGTGGGDFYLIKTDAMGEVAPEL